MTASFQGACSLLSGCASSVVELEHWFRVGGGGFRV